MGDYAASGGYYIACMADKIYAEPSTITGSIGIFSMIPNASELMNDKIGISLDTLNLGKYASSFNLFHDHAPGEAAILQQMTNNGYEMFLNRVAEGRDMTRDEVHAIAQGRVWTGAEALNNGLVDKLGSLEDAIVMAAELAQIETYRTTNYPRFKVDLEDAFSPFSISLKTKEKLLREELGTENYSIYKNIKEYTDIKGIQARMPYVLEIK